jgi:RNA polymerase sigma-70 factor (ECF subfamily)
MQAALDRGALLTQAEFHDAISKKSDSWFSACLRITRSRELAEDAVQDGLLQAWNKRHQFHRDASLETWIHRITVNAALRLLRKQRPGRFEPLEMDITDDGDTPERSRVEHDLGDQLTSALRHLTHLERVCFVLKHLEQWKLEEIAHELDTNVSSVKQALFRGVKKLRVSMADLRDS